MTKIADDDRLDPRIRRIMGVTPDARAGADVADRDELMAKAHSEKALKMRAAVDANLDRIDSTDLAPLEGLDISTLEFTSAPDGNQIKVSFMRPQVEGPVPCVYYIHGGGMQTMSAFLGMYQCWGRLIAHQGVAVAMVDFRNALHPSSTPEVAPFPAGLNDCVSGLNWLVDQADELGLDADKIIVAGESGGGNLAIATGMQLLRKGDIDKISGIYALCPYLAGEWPQARFPSSTDNNGLFINTWGNNARMAYGIEAFDEANPLAWPIFATADDLTGLPTTVISVNECDPLRDEGIEFYRMLNQAGVSARCRQVMGTLHGSEIFSVSCPEIATETAISVAHLAKTG